MSADRLLSGFHLRSCSVKPLPQALLHNKHVIQSSIAPIFQFLGTIFEGLDTVISYSTVNLFDIPYDSIDWYQTNARPVLTSKSVAGI